MTPERFDHLLSLVKEDLSPKPSPFRRPINAEEKLLVTLRYLATGDSQQSHAFSFNLGRSTVSKIIAETCKALWSRLASQYVKFPQCKEEWQNIASEFQEQWNMPHVLGALDGKHVRIKCPKFGGSNFFNYKCYHSTVLMAICDSKYRFIYVDIGQYGRENDASIFSASLLHHAFERNTLNLPDPDLLGEDTLPYTLVGDEIFALKTWLMKPYGGRDLSEEKRIYNYRLSRARRTIENAFGILAARWQIYNRPICANFTTIDAIVKATIALHNYLLCTSNAHYTPAGFVDCCTSDSFIEGDWRQTVAHAENPALSNLSRVASMNYTHDAKRTRELFCKYVNSEQGKVAWQINHVRNPGVTVCT
jgi:phage FluMu protein Com